MDEPGAEHWPAVRAGVLRDAIGVGLAAGAQVLPDPQRLGLDVAAPAAFIALLGPRLRAARSRWVALAAVAVALAALTTALLRLVL